LSKKSTFISLSFDYFWTQFRPAFGPFGPRTADLKSSARPGQFPSLVLNHLNSLCGQFKIRRCTCRNTYQCECSMRLRVSNSIDRRPSSSPARHFMMSCVFNYCRVHRLFVALWLFVSLCLHFESPSTSTYRVHLFVCYVSQSLMNRSALPSPWES